MKRLNVRAVGVCVIGITVAIGLGTSVLGDTPSVSGPVLVSPSDGAEGVELNPVLQWSTTTFSTTWYGVYFGTQDPPPLVGTTRETWWPTVTLPEEKYFWRIVVTNRGETVEGPVWSFTSAPTPAPGAPTIACPSDQHVTSSSPIAVSYPEPTVTGGVPPVTIQSLPVSGSVFPVGTTPVVAIATDAIQRQASCSFNVMVMEPAPVPPPPGGTIWGVTAPDILGTCTAAIHDQYVIDGGDGYLYRTWHPQQDPSGCWFGHEHGDDPQTIENWEIAARPVLFGYVGRRMPMPDEPDGHEEPHEGFKVFVANPGEHNDEGRINRVYSRSVFHMGTGGPKRFTMQHHSADIALIHPEFNLKAFTRLMMDTGGANTVCDPRADAPTKDVISLASPCKLNSSYEIWGTTQTVQYQGQVVYRSFATPATFDPVTVFNPANPAEKVYAWDPRVAMIKNFPTDDWSHFRGCKRESYAQPGYWYNANGPTDFYTDAMGRELPANDPLVLVQTISRSNSVGAPATNDGLVQFKMRRNYCAPGLGLKN